jgi:hypothetical protein
LQVRIAAANLPRRTVPLVPEALAERLVSVVSVLTHLLSMACQSHQSSQLADRDCTVMPRDATQAVLLAVLLGSSSMPAWRAA